MKDPKLTLEHDFRNFSEIDQWAGQCSEEALEPALPIIDAHHHLADDERGRYLIEEFTCDASSGHNIIATVFMEFSSMYRADGPVAMQSIGEVEFVNGAAAMAASGRYGKTRVAAGIVGYADLMLGESVRPVLEALIAAGNGRMRGIRYGTAWMDTGKPLYGPRKVPAHLMADATFRKGYAQLHPLGLSYDAWIFFTQLANLVDLMRAYPDTSVIVDHCGGILGIPPHDGKRDEVFAVWLDRMRSLAAFPNISVKIGGLGMPYSGWGFHLRDLPATSEELAQAWRPYVETCIDIFGADRCMMESNFPPDKKACSYGVAWNAMKRITKNYSDSEKSALYRGTAKRVYRLSV